VSAGFYANPHNRGTAVNLLDVVVLGATEVDVDFNVNVNTFSMGYFSSLPGATQTRLPVPGSPSSQPPW